MKERLEDKQAECEPRGVLDDEVYPHRQAQAAVITAAVMMPVASPAMQWTGRADALLPEWPDELLVRPRLRFLCPP
jgi:hypothetical protein